MKFDYDSATPLYTQVSNQIEESILTDVFKEGERILYTTEISKTLNINTATVLKGMNLLVTKKIIEKRLGVGMFVLPHAKSKISNEGREQIFEKQIKPIVREAKYLGLD
ncbi:GntR family transcriptional regulator, partial [Staphylococcus succinus]|uniref:GntR family transcriptional regulator n=1 Tax=Staphylococcus succinus TaxID=61015 RepID=UPI000D1EC99D